MNTFFVLEYWSLQNALCKGFKFLQSIDTVIINIIGLLVKNANDLLIE